MTDTARIGRSKRKVIALLLALLISSVSVPGSAAPSTGLNPDQALGWTKYELSQLWYAVYGTMAGYRTPNWIGWYSAEYKVHWLQSCGPGTTAGSTLGHYCHLDENVYLDWDIARLMDTTYGDYAYSGIIAHEWGHHIQYLLGWPYTYRNKGYYANFELHADCLSGVWARWAYQRGVINADDVNAIRNFYWYYLGDANIWVQTDQYNNPDAHGTREQRYGWFNWGYGQYNLNSCATVFNA